jgi:hypothetical protein
MMANNGISGRDARRYGCIDLAAAINGTNAERPQQQPVKVVPFAGELQPVNRPPAAYRGQKSIASRLGQGGEVALSTPSELRVLDLVPPSKRGKVVLPSPRNGQEQIPAPINAGPQPPAFDRAKSLREQLLRRAQEKMNEDKVAKAARAAAKDGKPTVDAPQSKGDSKQTTVSKVLHAVVPPGIRHWFADQKKNSRSARRELTVKQASDSPRASKIADE